MLLLGLVVLGPKRLHAMLGHVARAKAELEKATRGIKSQLGAELDAAPHDGNTRSSRNRLGSVNHPHILGIGTADPPVRPTQEQTFQAAGYQGERTRKIVLNSDIDY